jgi:hypothetical protein
LIVGTVELILIVESTHNTLNAPDYLYTCLPPPLLVCGLLICRLCSSLCHGWLAAVHTHNTSGQAERILVMLHWTLKNSFKCINHVLYRSRLKPIIISRTMVMFYDYLDTCLPNCRPHINNIQIDVSKRCLELAISYRSHNIYTIFILYFWHVDHIGIHSQYSYTLIPYIRNLKAMPVMVFRSFYC